MTILYINDEHCSSLEQLKQYFRTVTTYGSHITMELLDYGRAGDLAKWLYEKGETELAEAIGNISNNLGDSEYFSHLAAIVIGERVSMEKPKFQKCFQIENVSTKKEDNGITVFVQLKVLLSVNESYEFAVRTNWGIKGNIVNPYNFDEGSSMNLKFNFRKCPNVTINKLAFLVDGKEIDGIDGILLGQDQVEFTIGDCTFCMIHIVDENFETNDGNNTHNKPVKDFYIGQTVVTQKMWKAVMGNTDRKIGELVYQSSNCGWRSTFQTNKLRGGNKPMVGISYEDCIAFIKKLNDITGKHFRLPTDREWLFAANGTVVEKNCHQTNLQESAWFAENSKNELHDVSQRTPNQFGLYDMYGNVWERVLDRQIKRGGSYATLYNYDTCLPIGYGIDSEKCYDNDTGFRLLLVNNEDTDFGKEYVDLGLSVLWARNWISSFDDTDKSLPTEELATELFEKCNIEEILYLTTYKITGSNGNYIYVPSFWLLLSGKKYGNKCQALNFRYSQMRIVCHKNIQGLLKIKHK